MARGIKARCCLPLRHFEETGENSLIAVVMKFVVACKGKEDPKAWTEGEEDLSSCIHPHLEDKSKEWWHRTRQPTWDPPCSFGGQNMSQHFPIARASETKRPWAIRRNMPSSRPHSRQLWGSSSQLAYVQELWSTPDSPQPL